MLIELSHDQIKALLDEARYPASYDESIVILENANKELTEMANIDFNDCGDACKL